MSEKGWKELKEIIRDIKQNNIDDIYLLCQFLLSVMNVIEDKEREGK